MSQLANAVARLWKPNASLEPPTFTDRSIPIAVMGMTGAGKTTLISKITGLDMEIGRGLKSCTKEIQIATIQMDKHEIHLIDTPGFDDTELTDSDILIRIATYLMTGVRLSGILYLHPINTDRAGGAATRNLKMFQNLVGADNMGNVKLVTTKWSKTTPEEGQRYLVELLQDFWKDMIAAGAQVDRCDDAAKDGKRIIRSILKTSPLTLQLQRELEDGLKLEQTAAGKSVMDQLQELQQRHNQEIEELRRRLDDATLHRDTEAALRREYEEKLQKQDKATKQTQKLLEADIKNLQEELTKLKERSGGCIIL